MEGKGGWLDEKYDGCPSKMRVKKKSVNYRLIINALGLARKERLELPTPSFGD